MGSDNSRRVALLLQWMCAFLVFSPPSLCQSVASVAPARNSKPLSFEVASVRPFDLSKQQMGEPVGPDQNGMRLVSDLDFFIELAYGVRGQQIAGLPAWTRGQFYEIRAKTAVPSTPAEVNEMLQSLLQDRFKLVSHLETRTLPVYSLVVGKGGLKVQPVAADVKTSYSSSRVSLRGVLTTTQIADQLTASLHKNVIDSTGLTERYRIDLKWAPDVQIQTGDELPSDASIFTALQEQLGLKLESRKGPVQILVIDHLERPSDN